MNRHDEQNAQPTVAFLVARGVVFSLLGTIFELESALSMAIGVEKGPRGSQLPAALTSLKRPFLKKKKKRRKGARGESIAHGALTSLRDLSFLEKNYP